jgi:hypothetical protein
MEKPFRLLGAALALAALLMMLLASTMPWGNLDVKTKIGIIPVTLKADVYEYGINYEANLSGAGLLSGARIPTKIADKKVFLTGLGGFQETIGFVKGSSKEKVIYATSYTWPPPNNGTAETKITTMIGTIPWWPVGLAQDVGISVELTGAVNVSELTVVKVTFELHRTIDGADRYKVAYSSTPGNVLKNVGDRATVWGKVTADDDFGNFTVVAKVQLELKDKFGNTNKRPEGGYYELVPPPSEVRLWTMGTDKTARIGMMVAAFPLGLVSLTILAVGAVLGLFGGSRKRAARWAWMLCLTGAILALLAVLFYVLGVGALIELTGYGDWFSWNPQFYLAAAGACLSFAPGILLFVVRPPPGPPKATDKKISKAEKAGGDHGTPKTPVAKKPDQAGESGAVFRKILEGKDPPSSKDMEAAQEYFLKQQAANAATEKPPHDDAAAKGAGGNNQ